MFEVNTSQKYFFDVFPECLEDSELCRILNNARITSINVYRKSRKFEIKLTTDNIIHAKELHLAEKFMQEKYKLQSVSLKPYFNKCGCLEQAVIQYLDSLVFIAGTKSIPAKYILDGCTAECKDGVLNIKLKTKGKEILKAYKVNNEFEKVIKDFFGSKVSVKFVDPDCDPEESFNYDGYFIEETYKNDSDDKNSILNSITCGCTDYNQTKQEKRNKDNESTKKNNDFIQKKKRSRKEPEEGAILGRKINDKILKMSEINIDSGLVIVKGEIFSIEFRELRGGKYLVIFDITDCTSSITVKFFSEPDRVGLLQEQLKSGKCVLVRGEVQYDKFTKEITLFANDIVEGSIQKRKDNFPEKRVELHLHSQMSAMDGVAPVAELVKRASEWGHPAIAITDHGVVQAYPDAFSASKKHNIKVIYGIESYLVDDTKEDYTKAKSYHAIILVKNTVGLKNLYKLVSISHLEYYHKRPRMPKRLINEMREGLILGSACEAGELYRAILHGANDEEIKSIVDFYDYLEIQPLGNNRFLIENNSVKSFEELKDINRKIVKLGEEHNKPVVATCDVHFKDPEDEVFRRILMAGQGYNDADNQAPLFLRTTEEMLEEFSYLGEDKAYEVVITNTRKIAEEIEVISPVPEGTFPPKMEGAEHEIREMATRTAISIYGDPLPEIVQQRLEKELNSIIKNGFSVMYLIAQRLVKKSLDDGYLVGSRGSVGSSFVANMVGITEVNSLQPHYICEKCKYSEFILDGSYDCGFDLPEKDCPRCGEPLKKDGYDIPFETFLGFDGDKEPDIDLNFSGEYQPVAHKYTEELFGEKQVYRAGTIASVAEKTAYGFVKNYLDERNIVVTNAEINRLVKGCTGVKRTTGQHPGGIMIVPQDKEIFDFSPIQRPADDTSSNVITTHFDYHFLHGSILKLDILGHDDPTVIRMLEDMTGVNARKIPIGEKYTMKLFSSTEPLGVKPEDIMSEVGTYAIPEFGTKFVRQMLVDTRPTTFSELIKISGLSHGTDVWLNNAQDLIRDNIATLSETICCRDDIMTYLIHKGLEPKMAFKIMENVRKGKGLTEDYEKAMIEKDVPNWYIDSCKKIKYMFPKAHAAAYVMMAFRIAWFKVYYPECFYATYFTVRADEFDADVITTGQDRVLLKIKELEQKGVNATQKEKNLLTILEVANEMYARGIKFLPVDIYKSHDTKFVIEDGKLRPPLNSLQGLGEAAAKSIVEARKKGKFMSIDDLKNRAKISKAVIEILKNYGCLDGMSESNQISIFDL